MQSTIKASQEMKEKKKWKHEEMKTRRNRRP